MRPFYCLLSVSAVFWRFIHIVASVSTSFFFWMNHSPSCGYTGTPCFSQIHVPPLRFYGTPTLLPVFTSRKRSEERFHFCGEKPKAKLMFSVCVAAHSQLGERPPGSFPGNHTGTPTAAPHHWHLNAGPTSLTGQLSVPRHRLFCTFLLVLYVSVVLGLVC